MLIFYLRGKRRGFTIFWCFRFLNRPKWPLFFSLFLFNLVIETKGCVRLKHEKKAKDYNDYLLLSEKIFGHQNIYENENLGSLKNSSYEKCILCRGIAYNKKSPSTNSDLAIAFLFGTAKHNVLNWARSLRSTGCKCRILFLVDSSYLRIFNKQELNALHDCGVTFWKTKEALPNVQINMMMLREFYILKFLDEYGFLFNRVMISDVFDTMFQKDPFSAKIPNDSVAVSIEKVRFLNHTTNTAWLYNLEPEEFNYEFWKYKFVLNNGFKIGPVDKMLALYKAAFGVDFIFRKNVNDQAALNYVYYNGLYKDIWVDFDALYYSSACYSVYELKGEKNGMIREHEAKTFPYVIHQFDRICPAIEHFNAICPSAGKWHESPKGRLDHIVQECGSYISTNLIDHSNDGE
jgi:hypothetical protein